MNTIRVVDVWKKLDGKDVLTGVNLEVAEGETLVVIGGSGSGKSVLLKHIIGLMKPDRGQVLIDDERIDDAGELQLENVRKKFGMLFQSAALLNSLSVADNVALPLREHTDMPEDKVRGVVKEKLLLVNLDGVQQQKPDTLSGGMKKRVGLARAIVRDPKIILYDEPTSGLDPVIAKTIENLIMDLQKKLRITSVVVTHDIESAYRMADRIAMLFHGRIIEAGTPDEIKRSENPAVRQLTRGDITGPLTVRWVQRSE